MDSLVRDDAAHIPAHGRRGHVRARALPRRARQSLAAVLHLHVQQPATTRARCRHAGTKVPRCPSPTPAHPFIGPRLQTNKQTA